MASPNSTFTELVSTTFRKHGRSFVDNVSAHNALYRAIVDKKQYMLEDGGLSIVEPLDYAENSTYQRYSGYDQLNVSASDVLSAAEFQWKQIAIHVTASGQELRTNSGGSRIINLVKSRIKNAMRTFANNFSEDMYSAGSLSNQIGGLQALVSAAGTGTVGGIDSSTWTFWRNGLVDVSDELSAAVSATTIEQLLLAMWLAGTRGSDTPDLILMADSYYKFYELSQVTLKRYADTETADGGFGGLRYKGAKVLFDSGGGIPASTIYMLNTDYLKLRVHKDANLSVLEEAKPYNQDAAVIPVLWMGNMTCSNRARQVTIKP